MPNILVKTNDDKKYEVDIEIVRLCPTLHHMLAIGLNGNNPEIFLKNIDSSPLELILKWCQHHKDDQFNEDLAKQSSLSDCPLFDFWDQNFIQKVEESLLFEVMMAAVYLDVRPLVDITAKEIAKLVVCKTPEDIRLKWNIECDFTPEEDEYMRKVNEWAEVKASVEPTSVLLSHFLNQTEDETKDETEDETLEDQQMDQ